MNIPHPALNEPPGFAEHLYTETMVNTGNEMVAELHQTKKNSTKPGKKVETFTGVKNQSSIVKTNTDSFKSEEIKNLQQQLVKYENDIVLKDAEIKRLSEKIGMAKPNMDHFSYVASQDLKEPLRMVTSYLALLKNKFGAQLDVKANTYIDIAIDGGAKLHIMFNSLLDLSQICKKDVQKKQVNLDLLLLEVFMNISKKIKEYNAQINIITALPVLPVYEKSVKLLLENLIRNAIKFSKKDEIPVVEISATEKKSVWEFCIADNGIGIEAIHYQQIFAVFSKLHTAVTYPGNGIGLAICKKAVEQHGGTIWVNAEINKGSKFYFTLPK